LMRQGSDAGSIAVLYRANAQSRVLEEAFVRSGTPYRVYGGLRFYERKEVKDLIAYLRALVNPDDDVSLRRIINEPKRGIGDATVEKAAEYARENDMPLMSAVLDWENLPLSARPKKLLGAFAELMIDLTEQMYEQTPVEFVQTLIDKTGYVKALEEAKDETTETRIENIREFQGAVNEYCQHNPEAGLSEFLENVALVSDLDAMNENGGAVTLMTLHSAKGLEFDNVFLAGMEEGIFPITRALFDDKQMEEERRLCYVGITRARKRLFLSHAYTRALYNTRNSNDRSRFIDEIPSRLIIEGAGRMETRRVPPASQSQWGTHTPGQGGIRGNGDIKTRRPAPRPAGNTINIPGVSRGFENPAPVRGISVFHEGDAVRHRVFGLGIVAAVIGAGSQQKVTIRFDSGDEKTFYASSAPIMKVER
ncbi:MAG: 3'-5' exonuclease, partial [bacterium]